MKKLLQILIVLTLYSCSFDNKTGIWNDASDILVDNQSTESIINNQSEVKYEDIFTKDESFNEEREPPNLYSFVIDQAVKINNWAEEYAIPTNNISNFSYNDKKVLLLKSSKLSSLSSGTSELSFLSRKIIFYQNNLISHDHKGTIFVYSLSLKKKIFQYNFYKKSFKNINKKIDLIVDNNILYAADNLGYLYAFNLDAKSIMWAKNYGIPFRSNLKFANNQIFLANQDNEIYAINSNTGDKAWTLATGLTFLKSDFKNNFALDLVNNNLFFLNTSGELYSINYISQKINWVLNFKNSLFAEDTELFLSHPLVIKNNNLIITTDKAILSYNSLMASKNWNFNAEPIFKPIITKNNTYVLLKNNLVICLNNQDGSIIWSKNIYKNLKNKKIIKNFGSIADFKIVNNKPTIYSNNGYLISLNAKNGNLSSESRINKNGIASEIVFLDNNMLFIDNKNKLLKFN